MIKKYFNKIMALGIIATSLITLNPISASAEWKQDSTGWWYTEGSSWATGWRQIDGKWYYFYSDGYAAKGWQKINDNWYYFDTDSYFGGGAMEHDTIIDGYYLNSNGVWSSETTEIQKYADLLNDKSWQRNNGIIFFNDNWLGKINESTIDYNVIVDINQDGVYEMLLHHGSCEANLTTSVVTYNNGDIKIEHLPCDHGGYRGYSSSQKVFFIGGGHMDFYYTKGYKLENGSCKQVYSSSSYEYKGNSTYTVDGQNVSKEEYDESFKQFGDIVM